MDACGDPRSLASGVLQGMRPGFRASPDDGGRVIWHRGGMGTTVLIVDDHSHFRAWARVMLEESGYTVVSEAADGQSVFDVTCRLRPEVVLLDVQLPDMDGFEVARRLSTEPWTPAVVLTSTRDASDYGDRLARSCALGFLAKDELSAQALGGLLCARRDQ